MFRDQEFLTACVINTNIKKCAALFFLIIFAYKALRLRMKRLYSKKNQPFESLSALCYDNFIVDSLRKWTIPHSLYIRTLSVQTAPYRESWSTECK